MLTKRINIKSKILLSMLAIGFIPGLFGIASIYIWGMDIFRQSTGKSLIHLTHQIAANIRTTLDKEASEGMLIIQHPDIHLLVRSTTDKQKTLSASIKNGFNKGINHKPYATYLIYNQAGNLILQLGSEIEIPPASTFALSVFNSITANAMVGDPINSHTSKGFYIPIFTPIHSYTENKNSHIIGGMITYLNIPQLLSNIQISTPVEAGHFNLLTKSGMLVYDPIVTTGNIPFSTQLTDAFSAGTKQWNIEIDEHGIESLHTLTPLSLAYQTGLIYNGTDELYVSITQPAIEAFIAPTRSVLIGAALPGFILALLLTLIIYLLLKKLINPIHTLKEGASIIGSGNLDHKIEVQSSDEIEDLAEEFNKMTTALKSSYADLEKKIQERTLELKASNEELEKASHLKSQFLASMSHELRTPLNAIMGFSEVLTEEVYGKINEKQRRYLNNIYKSGKHLLEVINDILDLSKIEAGKMTLHLRELVVADAIIEVHNLSLQLASKANVELSFHTDQAPNLIIADCVRFRQIMYNLLSNAIKFTPEGGRISVTVQQIGSNLQVSVSDTGIGIPHEHFENIFKPFRQVDGSSSRNYEGTGLGLALTKEFVEMHGGHISVSSRQHQGSCFSFTIPMHTPLTLEPY